MTLTALVVVAVVTALAAHLIALYHLHGASTLLRSHDELMASVDRYLNGSHDRCCGRETALDTVERTLLPQGETLLAAAEDRIAAGERWLWPWVRVKP